MTGIKSKVHSDILQYYQEKIPKLPGENDSQWRDRIKNDPSLMKEALAGASFSEQIRLVAMRRALAVAGGQRTGSSGPGANNAATMSERYRADTVGSDDASRARFAEAQVAFLDEAFEYGSPENGSIFWTGVDPDKLVRQVHKWNSQFGAAMFGQLEATTDAKFINGAFDWSVKGSVQTTQMFFGAVSESYGRQARGHVTSVQMWGLRADAIFSTKELPTILQKMANQLAQKKTPDVTDISIVVLDPKTHPGEYKIFTNLEIGQIAYVNKIVPDSVSRWIRGKDDCGINGFVGSKIPALVKAFWFERGTRPPSDAARQIAQDYNLIKRG